MRPRSSLVWNYFEIIDNVSAKCKLCENVYSRKGRCTTALKSHIKAMHVEEFKELKSLEERAKKILAYQMQRKPPIMPQKPPKNAENNKIQDEINRLDHIAERVTNNKNEDEFDSFGKYIASSLRSLPQEFSIIAKTELQKTISNIQLKIFRRAKAGSNTQPQSPIDSETTATEFDFQTESLSPESDGCTIKIEYDEADEV